MLIPVFVASLRNFIALLRVPAFTQLWLGLLFFSLYDNKIPRRFGYNKVVYLL
jgi:hypothetical protein